MKVGIRALFAICLALTLTGCAMFEPKADPTVPLEPNGALRFADVPVPSGFKLLPQNSYSFENAGVRVGMLRYQGKATMEQVANFYKSSMAVHKWSLLNSIEYGQQMFNFEKENESCIVTLTPKGSTVLINISLGPIAAKTAAKRLEKTDRPLK